ncbi:hypothetical protein C1T28_11190 [Bacillus subtilis]|nr:hypothetical protein C1T25_15825 [Bacillus cereus]POO74350.1 hypothetical protein C1T28_11190 [Bacillus subtilis]
MYINQGEAVQVLYLKFAPLTKQNRFGIMFEYMLIYSHNDNKIISFPNIGRVLEEKLMACKNY